jgi:hypothetical protein
MVGPSQPPRPKIAEVEPLRTLDSVIFPACLKIGTNRTRTGQMPINIENRQMEDSYFLSHCDKEIVLVKMVLNLFVSVKFISRFLNWVEPFRGEISVAPDYKVSHPHHIEHRMKVSVAKYALGVCDGVVQPMNEGPGDARLKRPHETEIE